MLAGSELFMRVLQVIRFLNAYLWREERRGLNLVRAQLRLGHDLASGADMVPVRWALLKHVRRVLIVGELGARLIALS